MSFKIFSVLPHHTSHFQADRLPYTGLTDSLTEAFALFTSQDSIYYPASSSSLYIQPVVTITSILNIFSQLNNSLLESRFIQMFKFLVPLLLPMNMQPFENSSSFTQVFLSTVRLNTLNSLAVVAVRRHPT